MIGRLSATGAGSHSFEYSSREAMLQGIDGAVKAHERAHLLALGGNARGGISYDYIITADGHRYAVGGSVGVDLKPVPGDPRATIRKMRSIRAAALSPISPSSADRRIAAEAARIELQARQELEQQRMPEGPEAAETGTGTTVPEFPAADESRLYSSGTPEMIIKNAEAVRRSILQSGDLTARNIQLLARTYVMEMQAEKRLEEREADGKQINIVV